MAARKQPLFESIAIVGLGVMGGSLGLAIKKAKLAKKVIGYSRRTAILKQAKRARAIDVGTTQLNSTVANAELIVLATPPKTVVKYAQKLAKLAKQPTLITDVASTKEDIVGALDKSLPAHVSFVGGHPMCGSEKSGFEGAQRDLYKGAVCILTQTPKTQVAALKPLQRLWKALGSQVVLLTPEEHDAWTAQISHIPHLVAVAQALTPDAEALSLVGSGFLGVTRVSQSNPIMREQIITTNKKHILAGLDQLEARIADLREAIDQDKKANLRKLLVTAQQRREALNKARPKLSEKRWAQNVITIDGPSGTGKSSASKRVAKALGWTYLDSGAMYRAIAWLALETKTPLDAAAKLAKLAKAADIQFEWTRSGTAKVLLNGQDVSKKIRTPKVTRVASEIAALPPVRKALVVKQRAIGKTGRVVAEGRDAGTVIFPEAKTKIFLTASSKVRAKRRYLERKAQGDKISLKEVERQVVARDRRDKTRKASPLKAAKGAVLLDNTKLQLDETVDTILNLCQMNN